MEATRQARSKANELTASMRRDAGDVISQAEAVQVERRAARTGALLALRDSLARVEDETAGAASANRAKKVAAEEAKRKEAVELVERGRNPYEEFRKRAMRADARRQREQQAAAIDASQRRLASQIVTEDASERIAERSSRRRANSEQEYIAEVGRDRRTQRAEALIRSRTLDGRSALDPGGRASRVLPSEMAAPRRTHAFGTGRIATRPDGLGAVLIDHEASKRGMDSVRADPHTLRAKLGAKERLLMNQQELAELEEEEKEETVLGLGITGTAGLGLGLGAGPGADEEMGGGMAGLATTESVSNTGAASSSATAAGGGAAAARKIGGRRLKDLSVLE